MLLCVPAQGADNAAASFHGEEIIFGQGTLVVVLNLLKINGLVCAACRQMRGDGLLVNIGDEVGDGLADLCHFIDMQGIAWEQAAVRSTLRPR